MGAVMEYRWRIELFGSLAVRQGERVLTRFKTQKTAVLLARLACDLQHAHPREVLIDLLWPEADLDAGRQSLSQALSALRRQFEPPGIPPGAVILADRASVRLNPAGVSVDVAEFEAALQAAEAAGSDGDRAPPLARAVALYRGELLAGFYEDWILEERERLAERYGLALRRWIERLEQAGDVGTALEVAHHALRADPLREETHRTVMRLHAARGQPAVALRQYHELERLLRDELDAAPAEPTRALARQLSALASPRPLLRADPPGPARPPLPSRRPETGRHDASPPTALPLGTAAFHAFQESRAAAAFSTLRSPEAGESRLVTVLCLAMNRTAATAAGLQAEDATALAARAVVDILWKYEGRVERPRGDAIQAVFGVPQTREEDAERALHAALEIREAARPWGLEIAAGVATGDSEQGSADPRPPEAVTDTAASLLAETRPGQILVGETTYRLTRRAFEFSRSLSSAECGVRSAEWPTDGAVAAVDREGTSAHRAPDTPHSALRTPHSKGSDLDGALPVYQVVRPRPRPRKPRGIEGLRVELVGREQELAQLRGAFEAVLQEHGQIVSIVGEAGVGKSRLVAELKRGAAGGRRQPIAGRGEVDPVSLPPADGGRPPPLWLEGRCLEIGTTAGYWLFADLFRQYFTGRSDATDALLGDRIAGALCGFVEREELSEEQAAEIGPLLGNLLSIRFGSDWDRRLANTGPEQIKHRTLAAIREFFLTLARRQPVILVLEDLHWADSLSIDAISLLMEALARKEGARDAQRATPDTPPALMLLCIARPERAARCRHLMTAAARKCGELYTELRLRELTHSQSGQLLNSLLGRAELSPTVTATILETAQGNPFFLEELLRALIAEGALQRFEGVWQAQAGIEAASVPPSVQSVIRSRVDRLAPELQHVLQRASVIGRLFSRRLLERILVASPPDHTPAPGAREPRDALDDLEQALWELEEEEFIYQERVTPEVEYSFNHVLTRQTIHQSLTLRRRARFHQDAAEALESLHPDQRDEVVDQLAFHYEQSGVDEKAVAYLLRAAEKARRAYQNEKAIASFERVLERLDAPDFGMRIADSERPVLEWRLAATQGLARVHHATGQQREAEERFRQAIALSREIGRTPREITRLYYGLAMALYWQSRYEDAIRLGEEGLALLGADTESAEAALMNDAIAYSSYQKGDRARFRQIALRNARFLRRLPYEEELLLAYSAIATVYLDDDMEIEAGLEWLEDLERKAGEQHDLRAMAEVDSIRANLRAIIGDVREAVSLHQRAAAQFERIGDRKRQNSCIGRIGQSLLVLGELAAAAEQMFRAIQVADELGNQWHRANSLGLAGIIRLCQGSPEEAAYAFRKARQLFEEAAIPYQVAMADFGLGQVDLARGRRREAYRRFQGALLPACATRVGPRLLLCLLEEAAEDGEQFRAFCHRFRAEHPEARDPAFGQWYLEPAEPDSGFRILECESFDGGLRTLDCGSGTTAPTPKGPSLSPIRNSQSDIRNPTWVWHDASGDGPVRTEHGLEIHAACGQELVAPNQSAPRVLRPVRGDFAVQVVCSPVAGEKPARGGITLWESGQNCLRLERGMECPREITFEAKVASGNGVRNILGGRGRLPAERVFFRLERRRHQVTALCSEDGKHWLRVGQIEFPVEDPMEVGLFASSTSRFPAIYRGVYPHGTAIRFESFQLWRDAQRG